jgi:hypothetical protein
LFCLFLDLEPNFHRVYGAVQELLAVAQPIDDDTPAMQYARAALKRGVEKRFASVLHDENGAVLAAAFLHPSTFASVITVIVSPEITMKLTSKAKANLQIIQTKLATILPPSATVQKENLWDEWGTPSPLELEIRVYTRMLLEEPRVFQDVAEATLFRPFLAGKGLSLLAVCAGVFLTIRASSSDVETTFSLMGQIKSALRNRLGTDMHAALTFLTAQNRNLMSKTRKVAWFSRTERALLCLGDDTHPPMSPKAAMLKLKTSLQQSDKAVSEGGDVVLLEKSSTETEPLEPSESSYDSDDTEGEVQAFLLSTLSDEEQNLVFDADGDFQVDLAVELANSARMASARPVAAMDVDVVDSDGEDVATYEREAGLVESYIFEAMLADRGDGKRRITPTRKVQETRKDSASAAAAAAAVTDVAEAEEPSKKKRATVP